MTAPAFEVVHGQAEPLEERIARLEKTVRRQAMHQRSLIKLIDVLALEVAELSARSDNQNEAEPRGQYG